MSVMNEDEAEAATPGRFLLLMREAPERLTVRLVGTALNALTRGGSDAWLAQRTEILREAEALVLTKPDTEYDPVFPVLLGHLLDKSCPILVGTGT